MGVTQWPPEFGKSVALWDAVYAQDAAAVQKLLETPRGVQQIWQRTSVHLAVAKGNSKILKTLLFTPGVDVDARTIDGSTPLHLALEKNRKDLIQDLLLVGANPLLINRTGKNAIAMARNKGLADVSSMLRQHADSRPFQEALKAPQNQSQLSKSSARAGGKPNCN